MIILARASNPAMAASSGATTSGPAAKASIRQTLAAAGWATTISAKARDPARACSSHPPSWVSLPIWVAIPTASMITFWSVAAKQACLLSKSP